MVVEREGVEGERLTSWWGKGGSRRRKTNIMVVEREGVEGERPTSWWWKGRE